MFKFPQTTCSFRGNDHRMLKRTSWIYIGDRACALVVHCFSFLQANTRIGAWIIPHQFSSVYDHSYIICCNLCSVFKSATGPQLYRLCQSVVYAQEYNNRPAGDRYIVGHGTDGSSAFLISLEKCFPAFPLDGTRKLVKNLRHICIFACVNYVLLLYLIRYDFGLHDFL
jgi:hypothetical protein